MTHAWAIASALGLAVAAWGVALPASAQITVQLEGCGELGGVEVTRALELEIARAPETPLGVRVRCDDRGLLIEVDDPLTDKRLVRRVPGVEARRPGAVRTVALLVSELVLASWAELLFERASAARSEPRARALAEVERALGDPSRARVTPDPTHPDAPASGAADAPPASTVSGSPAPATAPPAATAAIAAPPASTSDASPDATTSALPSSALSSSGATTVRAGADVPPVASDVAPPLQLRADVAGGARLRDVAAPFVTWVGALDARVRLSATLSLGARVSVEVADIVRRAGTIAFATVGAGVLASAELVRRGPFALDVFAEARVAWLRLDGRPSRSSIEGRALDDVLAELEVCAAPGLELGPARVAMTLSAGVTVLGPFGTVTGERDVTLPGFFGGVGLRVGLR